MPEYTSAGGEAAEWPLALDLSGVEPLTGWTTESGVWAVNGAGAAAYWENTATARGVLVFASRILAAAMVVQAEVRLPSGGLSADRAGLTGHNLTDNVFQPGAYIGTLTVASAGPVVLSAPTTLQAFGDAPGVAFDQWHVVRAVICGAKATAFVDGVNRGSAYAGADYRAAHSVCLWAQNGRAHFRNIKVWTIGGLPA